MRLGGCILAASQTPESGTNDSGHLHLSMMNKKIIRNFEI